MATKTTAIKAINSYFNTGKPTREGWECRPKAGLAIFKAELDALSPEEKNELATLICKETGEELVAKTA
jgi:hypothetical protein